MAQYLQAVFNKKGSRRSVVICALLLLLLAIVVLCNLSGLRAAMQEMAWFLQSKLIRRALIGGVLVALCAALLGVILVLKRYSMIGDGLSHVAFGALTVAVSLGTVTAEGLPHLLPAGFRDGIEQLCANISTSPMVFTLVIVVVCAVLLLRISQNSKLRGDSAIALISTSALALGVIVTSVSEGMNIDVQGYMFGSIMATSTTDVYVSLVLCVIVLAMFAAFYPRIFSVTFDENFARGTGTNAGLYNLMIAVLTAMTIVVGMRIMGTMLISSLIIFPALSSMRVFSRFKLVVVSSAVISVVCVVVGFVLSCLYSFPTGASIVAVNLVMFLICTVAGALRV